MSRIGPESLVRELDSAGLLPAGFGLLLCEVLRDRFTSDLVWVDGKPLSKREHPTAWWTAVYSNTSVVTQYDDGFTSWPEVGDRASCSLSMPSVVVGMLALLDVQPGHCVMEIGAGSGFNTALLSKLVGRDGEVVSLEVDPDLAGTARQNLRHSGYKTTEVQVFTKDGAHGLPNWGQPFDRVISTAAVQLGHVPYTWVEQTQPGGVIVTPVRAALTSGPLVRFVVNNDGTATGRMASMGAAFMELRSQRVAWADDELIDESAGDVSQRSTEHDPWLMFGQFAPRWALAVALPSCEYDLREREYLRLMDPVSGSWAVVRPDDRGGCVVRQYGVRRLWDDAEAAFGWWLDRGKPAGADWEWTITPDSQTIRLASE
ncbi:protein-L-isoaspartate O-methyltransferase family protein [Actinocrispum wychmicini]|uniref:Protein-L-isoaspartate O-methyltransferase n=1 Tax=Actinocrispum wychmicini TaxID=1213861 RepID=A0A4R2IPT0_9PSEU|nr:methyltransferase domain-containing protein [Actinocrispum wychmicini]TCO47341.1 protein-L-isoaspartate(D-aspartate) O-methyltransferase [Actinocrispum wychmicini]